VARQVAEVGRNIPGLGEGLVGRRLHALVPDQGTPQVRRKGLDGRGESVAGGQGAGAARQMYGHQIAGGALDRQVATRVVVQAATARGAVTRSVSALAQRGLAHAASTAMERMGSCAVVRSTAKTSITTAAAHSGWCAL